jgi:cell shape-determining protein MreD
MRLDMNLPVAGITLFAAALLQDLIPETPSFPAKVVFLTAVARYSALTKPVWVALTVAAWAGGLTDALGGLPLFCTFSFLLAMYFVVRMLQRVFLEATLVQGTLLVGCAALAQAVWTQLWAGTGEPFFEWRTLLALGCAVPAGGVAGCAGFAVCGLADRVSGSVKPVKENNGILWAEPNR